MNLKSLSKKQQPKKISLYEITNSGLSKMLFQKEILIELLKQRHKIVSEKSFRQEEMLPIP